MRIFKKQQGISLVLVIFLLAVVAVLIVSLTRVAGTQHFSSAYVYRNGQAYFAARSAIDYAIARIAAGGGCAGVAGNLVLQGYNVTITCNVSGTYNEGNLLDVYSIYALTALASSGSFQAPDASNRVVRTTVKFP